MYFYIKHKPYYHLTTKENTIIFSINKSESLDILLEYIDRNYTMTTLIVFSEKVYWECCEKLSNNIIILDDEIVPELSDYKPDSNRYKSKRSKYGSPLKEITGGYVFKFGKYKGMEARDVPDNYIAWFRDNVERSKW